MTDRPNEPMVMDRIRSVGSNRPSRTHGTREPEALEGEADIHEARQGGAPEPESDKASDRSRRDTKPRAGVCATPIVAQPVAKDLREVMLLPPPPSSLPSRSES